MKRDGVIGGKGMRGCIAFERGYCLAAVYSVIVLLFLLLLLRKKIKLLSSRCDLISEMSIFSSLSLDTHSVVATIISLMCVSRVFSLSTKKRGMRCPLQWLSTTTESSSSFGFIECLADWLTCLFSSVSPSFLPLRHVFLPRLPLAVWLSTWLKRCAVIQDEWQQLLLSVSRLQQSWHYFCCSDQRLTDWKKVLPLGMFVAA